MDITLQEMYELGGDIWDIDFDLWENLRTLPLDNLTEQLTQDKPKKVNFEIGNVLIVILIMIGI